MTDAGLRARRLEPVLIIVLSGALGLAWWCLGILVAGDAALAVFCPGTAVSVMILVFLAPEHRVAASVPMGFVPLLSAPWTTPTGDNDGLWVSIFPVLMVWIVALLFTAFGVQRLLGRRRERERAASIGRPWLLGVEVSAVALALVGAIWLQAMVLAGPWSDLQSQLSTYAVPVGFTTVGWEREGSSRCSDIGCRPQIGLKMNSALSPNAACGTLKESMQRWPGTKTISDDQPIGDWEKCVYFTSQRWAGTTREVQAMVEAPPGRQVQVTVRMLADCVQTC